MGNEAKAAEVTEKVSVDEFKAILQKVAPDANNIDELAKQLAESEKTAVGTLEEFKSGLERALKEGTKLEDAVGQFAKEGKFGGAATKEAGFFARNFLKDASKGISFGNVNKINAALAVAGTYAAYKVVQAALGGGKEQSIS